MDVEPGKAIEAEGEVGRVGAPQRGQSLTEADRASVVRPARYGLDVERHTRGTVDLGPLRDEGDLVSSPCALARGAQGVALETAVGEGWIARSRRSGRWDGDDSTGAILTEVSPPPDGRVGTPDGTAWQRRGVRALAPTRMEASATRRGLLGAALGAAATVALARARGRVGSRGPGEVAFWAADRAGHRLHGLDSAGLVRTSVDLPAPVAMRRPERSRIGEDAPVALVVTSATEGRWDRPRRDWRIGPAGNVLSVGP